MSSESLQGSPLTVATPWYPTPFNRMAGSFVAEHAAISATLPGIGPGGVHTVHAQEWPGSAADAVPAWRPAFDATLDALARSGGTRLSAVAGPLDRVPVFTVSGASMSERTAAMVRDVARVLGRFDSPLVHGHVGYSGGVLAARLADPQAKVFATEHSTTLRQVLEQGAVRDDYAELIERASVLYCVTDMVRRQILDVLPDPDGTVQVLHNPVDFTSVPRRSAPPESLRQWVFVGGLIERKGVLRLVRAFAAAARDDAGVTLTMFGDGELADTIVSIAKDAGVADRLDLRGVVPHREVVAALPQFDILFAPSTYETFHLAVPEAVAAGLPVIVTRSGGPEEALAGVEHLVGTFVDVNDDPDELVDAWHDLNSRIESLDVDQARTILDARYGRSAIAARLASDYGLNSGARDPGAQEFSRGGDPSARFARSRQTQPVPARRIPDPPGRERLDVVSRPVVIVAVSGSRRYAVEPDIEAVRQLGVEGLVVTDDTEVKGWGSAAGLMGLGSKSVPGLASSKVVTRAPTLPLKARLRREAGRLRREALQRLKDRSAAAPAARQPAQGPAEGILGGEGTLVIGDVQSMPLAASMLEAYPGLRPVVELDRGGVLGPTPDADDARDAG